MGYERYEELVSIIPFIANEIHRRFDKKSDSRQEADADWNNVRSGNPSNTKSKSMGLGSN